MPAIILPEKYYRTHFLEFIEQVKARYSDFLDTNEEAFLRDFEALNEDAQCVFIRMANRHGRYFHRSTLVYPEIEDLDRSLAELELAGFARRPSAEGGDSSVALLESLDKTRLQSLASSMGVAFRASWTRLRLIESVEALLRQGATLPAAFHDEFVERLRVEALEYLKFLFFGEIRENLGLYTLRDLGVRRADTVKAGAGARFHLKEEARAQYFYARLGKQLESGDLDPVEASPVDWPSPGNAYTEKLREDAIVEIGYSLSRAGREPEACELLAMAKTHPGTERYVRSLYKLDRKEECRRRLEAMIDDPSSDSELSFAEDYLLRKFNQKRTHVFTDMLQRAAIVTLDEGYLQDAETGVQESLRAEGKLAYRSENEIWNALFGLVFWEELFEGPGVFSPFERAPQDLFGADFYERRREAIERKLAIFADPAAAADFVRRTFAERQGSLNGVFHWHDSLERTLPRLIVASPAGALPHVLRAMAKDYAKLRSGFPDLLVIDERGVRFIEVKAEGDQIRASQFQRIRLLREAGFEAEILKVVWRSDPEATYVVVDLETTGTSPSHGRVTEIGAVKVRNGEIVEEFTTLVNPERPIPRFITQLTGISDEMVASAPRFAEIADRLADFTRDAIFVAHNVGFDYGFLRAEFGRLDRPFVRRKLCTRVAMKRAYPGLKSYGLKPLCEAFGIDLTQHHRAQADARAAARLLKLVNEKRASEATSGSGNP